MTSQIRSSPQGNGQQTRQMAIPLKLHISEDTNNWYEGNLRVYFWGILFFTDIEEVTKRGWEIEEVQKSKKKIGETAYKNLGERNKKLIKYNWTLWDTNKL